MRPEYASILERRYRNQQHSLAEHMKSLNIQNMHTNVASGYISEHYKLSGPQFTDMRFDNVQLR